MQAKASGDKATANALKLVCNTTYGCLLNQYNDLYDPLMGRSVCISGQLYLLELCIHLYREIPDLKLIQNNTDGLMIEFDDCFYPQVLEITKEWQERTGFELEEDSIIKIAQKDVNGYIEVQADGTVKAKGGYLVKGVATAGAFNVNNSCTIVAAALKEYLVNGTPVEETINNCNDIMQFQIIAKAGAKYKESYHIVDGVKQPVQKVNRVYATNNKRYGKLYKTKADTNTTAKIDSLPEHCIIDNDNKLTIKDIDKTFYIEMAQKRVDDFKGTDKNILKGQITMATTMAATKTKLNVYQKLIKAREMFINSEISQSGKNMQLTYKYFELKDIVPSITKIFSELGLIAIDTFTADVATLTIVNTDEPSETIPFVAPFNQIQPIVSNSGKQVTNDMQALGSSITYMRRYMYMIAMDICVNDDIEPTITHDTNAKTQSNAEPVQPPVAHKAPATPQERENVKVKLTAPTEQANELQMAGLKTAIKKLREVYPGAEAYVNKLMIETNSLQKVTKERCEQLINEIAEMTKGQ